MNQWIWTSSRRLTAGKSLPYGYLYFTSVVFLSIRRVRGRPSLRKKFYLSFPFFSFPFLSLFSRSLFLFLSLLSNCHRPVALPSLARCPYPINTSLTHVSKKKSLTSTRRQRTYWQGEREEKTRTVVAAAVMAPSTNLYIIHHILYSASFSCVDSSFSLKTASCENIN